MKIYFIFYGSVNIMEPRNAMAALSTGKNKCNRTVLCNTIKGWLLLLQREILFHMRRGFYQICRILKGLKN